jgi:hypothetical protein
VRYYRRRWTPPFLRVLLIESGSRAIIERLLPQIYAQHGANTRVDVVTCYDGAPQGLNPDTGRVYWVTDYGPQDRQKLLEELLERTYTIMGVVCSAEPIMTKWKWWLVYKIPAKLFVINENCDYFWVHLANWRTILHFALFRAGLTGAGAVHTVARLLLFPFTLAYLILFAAWVHLRRRVRLALAHR